MCVNYYFFKQIFLLSFFCALSLSVSENKEKEEDVKILNANRLSHTTQNNKWQIFRITIANIFFSFVTAQLCICSNFFFRFKFLGKKSISNFLCSILFSIQALKADPDAASLKGSTWDRSEKGESMWNCAIRSVPDNANWNSWRRKKTRVKDRALENAKNCEIVDFF